MKIETTTKRQHCDRIIDYDLSALVIAVNLNKSINFSKINATATATAACCFSVAIVIDKCCKISRLTKTKTKTKSNALKGLFFYAYSKNIYISFCLLAVFELI